MATKMAAYVVVGLPTKRCSLLKSPFTNKGAGSKNTCLKDVFFSAFSSPKAKAKAKGETASLSFDSSFDIPRIAVAGAKPAFIGLRMREKPRGKNTISPCEVREWRHRIKPKLTLSWHSFRWQDNLGLVGAADHNEWQPKKDQGSLPPKPIGEGTEGDTSSYGGIKIEAQNTGIPASLS